MPRKPRQKSETGIYHLMMRGINRQNIFEDNEDYLKFIEIIRRYKEKCGFSLYAYCLMPNHVHMLLEVGMEPLEQIMRRICGSYVYWYNHKYERVGNLFQDRFKSEPVEDNMYLLTVLRYIHQNPLKAGLVKNIGKYRWSSYSEYVRNSMLVDAYFILEMFSRDREDQKKRFVNYHNLPAEDTCLEMEEKHRISDDEGRDIIKKLCKVNHPKEVQNLDNAMRNTYLKELKKERRLSIRQIERLTGINRGIIQRA